MRLKHKWLFAGLALVAGLMLPKAGLAEQDNKTAVLVAPQEGPAGKEFADSPPLGKDTRLTTLPNGLTVLVKVDRRFPMVSTRIFAPAGSADEKASQAGISHVLEHMVFKGTAKRPKGAVSREVEAAGGYLNAATRFDMTEYIIDLPAASWKLGMDIVRDMAFHPTLDAAELESEKNVVLAELKRGLDNPYSVLFQAAQASALHGTPYERPIIGYEKTIKGISVQDMRDYLHKWYQPRNLLLTVVGDVNPDDVLVEAAKTFGGYTNTEELSVVEPLNAAAIQPAYQLKEGVPAVTVQSGPWNKVYLTVAMPVPGEKDSRSPTLDVLAQLLGGDETSYLYRTYKYDRKLVDSISASSYTFDRVGLFFITAQLDADKLMPFWTAFTADLGNLKASMFTPTQLDRAKLNIEDSFFRSRETLGELASSLGYYQFNLGGEQGEINTLQQLKAVDLPGLQQVLNQWVVPARFTTVALVPEAAAKPELAEQLSALLPVGDVKTVAAAADKSVGAVEVVDLGQGRTVVLTPDKTMPYFALDMIFSGGETLLTPEEQGLSALTARTLTTGTARMTKVALDEYMADRAAGIGAATGRTGFAVSLSGQNRFRGELFDMLAEVLKTPAFRDDEVDREKESQIAAIHNTEDQPLGLAFRKMNPFLFPKSVYGYETLGTVNGVKSFDRKDVVEFWDRQKTRPWVLSVAGDFDREAVLTFAQSLPVPSAPKVEIAAPEWNSVHKLDLTLAQRKQAHLMLVFKTAPQNSADTPALSLLQATLGGMGGPLFTRLRDDMGLGYTVSMFNRQDEKNGYVVFYIGTDPDRLEEAQAGFTTIIEELRAKPLSVDDLARGRSQLEGDYYRERQSLSSRAGEAASLVFTGRSPEYFKELIGKADKVKPEDLQNLAKKYFQIKDAYIVTVLPN